MVDCPCAEAKPCAAARQTCSTNLCPTSTAPMTTAAWSSTLAVTMVRGETPNTIMSAILRRLLVGSYTPLRVPSQNTLGACAKGGACGIPREGGFCEWTRLEVLLEVRTHACCIHVCVCCVCCVCCVERAPLLTTRGSRARKSEGTRSARSFGRRLNGSCKM